MIDHRSYAHNLSSCEIIIKGLNFFHLNQAICDVLGVFFSKFSLFLKTLASICLFICRMNMFSDNLLD